MLHGLAWQAETFTKKQPNEIPACELACPIHKMGSKSPMFYHGTRFGPACKKPSNRPPRWMKACELACPAQNNGRRIRVYHVTRSGPASENLYEQVTESDKSMRISMPNSQQGSKSPMFYHGTRFGPACKNPSNRPPRWMKACELA